MGWLDAAIGRGIKKGVEQYLDSDKFKSVIFHKIHEQLKRPEYAPFVFIIHMQAELMRVDKTLPSEQALSVAKGVYKDFLHDEKCAFGDARYAWDKDGAVALAHAYEIDHWESAS